jgi:DhnA family fructose-bisphosphate aldolase class Ia
MESLQQRIQSLKVEGGILALLALDHGLTNGIEHSVQPVKVKSLLQVCREKIGGVVLTFGLAKYLDLDEKFVPVIVQCFGGPLGTEKVQIASIDQVLRLRATAVSVQLRLDAGRPPRPSHTREIEQLVAAAYQHDLPVLFMVNVHDSNNLLSVANAIRISQEMGADLIKIRVGVREEAPSEDVDILANAVKQAPPVLLAGGTLGSNLIAEFAIAAHQLFFSGYCIGRNIFQAQNPLSVVTELKRIWDKSRVTK